MQFSIVRYQTFFNESISCGIRGIATGRPLLRELTWRTYLSGPKYCNSRWNASRSRQVHLFLYIASHVPHNTCITQDYLLLSTYHILTWRIFWGIFLCFTFYRFAINLIQARSVIQSCLLHFDIRFDQCETVRNTNYPTGAWAHEETSPLPIVRGRNFCIEIKCLPGHFTVIIHDAAKYLYLYLCLNNSSCCLY